MAIINSKRFQCLGLFSMQKRKVLKENEYFHRSTKILAKNQLFNREI